MTFVEPALLSSKLPHFATPRSNHPQAARSFQVRILVRQSCYVRQTYGFDTRRCRVEPAPADRPNAVEDRLQGAPATGSASQAFGAAPSAELCRDPPQVPIAAAPEQSNSASAAQTFRSPAPSL